MRSYRPSIGIDNLGVAGAKELLGRLNVLRLLLISIDALSITT